MAGWDGSAPHSQREIVRSVLYSRRPMSACVRPDISLSFRNTSRTCIFTIAR